MATERNDTYLFTDGPMEHIAEDVVAIRAPRLGVVDFIRVCPMHAWASNQSVYRRMLPACPHCELLRDGEGRKRYDELQRRLMPEGARP